MQFDKFLRCAIVVVFRWSRFIFFTCLLFFSDEQCYETDLKPHFVARAAKVIIYKSRVGHLYGTEFEILAGWQY